ncbi:lipocalin family protein [Capnocytophaga genosp. AHN8471]|uniref:Lipocalin family protein n=1 Tax=Capnocytophaga genosp. AHN8471 TaxID=327574 RepID=A0ABS1YYV8_9FLAO|nr:lipocalin family protein [Capnocytophaga genosp. AHN8471]MBM0651610.1 lipocalin family protein [Capnocytophaga genosp. AHN8471]MBM0662052.1 lipocalin family protein [Capnocytophaga genosp. AHN8471]
MRKILLGAFIALATMVSSCGSKDDDSTNDPQALIGAWQLESISVNGKEIPLPACDGKEVQIYNGTQQQTYDFDTDNTGNCTFEKNTPTNYTVSGNTLKKGEDTYTFSISGNKLTLKYRDKNNNEGVAVFRKLTQSELEEINKMEYKPSQNNPLVGYWQIVSKTVNGVATTLDECTQRSMLVFGRDKLREYNFTYNNQQCSYGNVEAKAYTLLGNNSFMINDGKERALPTFEITNDQLTITTNTLENWQNRKTVEVYKRITEAAFQANIK